MLTKMKVIYIAVGFLLWTNVAVAFLNRHVIKYSEVAKSKKKNDQTDIYHLAQNNINEHSYYDYRHFYNMFEENIDFIEDKKAIIEYHDGSPHIFYTYKQLRKHINSFACALDNFNGGVQEKWYDEKQNGGRFRLLGIYAETTGNWIIADLASQISNVTTVILHAKFNIEEAIFALNQTRLEWLCIEIDIAEKLVSRFSDLPYLTHLIIMDNLSDLDDDAWASFYSKAHLGKDNKLNTFIKNMENTFKKDITKEDDKQSVNLIQRIEALAKEAKKYSIRVTKIQDFLNFGKEKRCAKKENYGDANFVTTIVYTSGTSGTPKGVMLTNKNIFHAVVPLKYFDVFQKRKGKIHFSYLPISHIYERVNVYFALLIKNRVIIWSKDIKRFSRDLQVIQPDILAGVPKIFNRLYETILNNIQLLPSKKRKIVTDVLKMRSSMTPKLGKFLDWILQISNRIRRCVNPNLSVMINGGGKLLPKVEIGLYHLLNVHVYQGYGLTESTGPLFLQKKKDHSTNNVGGPISAYTYFRLETWRVYSVHHEIPKGELQIKGGAIFAGYFLNPSETEKSFTSDGYFKTGDIVQLNKNGSITFLDRSKSLVKLSQGEYIETETLNNIYSEIPFINHCIVYGDDTMDRPVAIISVDVKSLIINMLNDHALEDKQALQKFNNGSLRITDELVNNDKIYINYVKEKLTEVHRTSGLNKYNEISDIYISTEEWNTSNFLTYNMKVKRFKVLERFNFFIRAVKDKSMVKI